MLDLFILSEFSKMTSISLIFLLFLLFRKCYTSQVPSVYLSKVADSSMLVFPVSGSSSVIAVYANIQLCTHRPIRLVIIRLPKVRLLLHPITRMSLIRLTRDRNRLKSAPKRKISMTTTTAAAATIVLTIPRFTEITTKSALRILQLRKRNLRRLATI